MDLQRLVFLKQEPLAKSALGQTVTVDRMALTGLYRVYVRQMQNGSALTGFQLATASAQAKDSSQVAAKAWMSGVQSLLGANALGNTVGRTSTAALKVIDRSTMSISQINALLPSGANLSKSSYNGVETINVSGQGVVLSNYLFKGVQIRLKGSAKNFEFSQNLVYPTSSAVISMNFIQAEPGSHTKMIKNNTVLGPRKIRGTKQFFTAQQKNSSATNYAQVDLIEGNFFSGMFGDNMVVQGSNVTGGLIIRNNVFDAAGWVTGKNDWHTLYPNHPHADLITVTAAFGNGIRIVNNVFWQNPVEPVSIPASISPDGVAKHAGSMRRYAGNALNPLDTGGIIAQNNAIRVMPNSGTTTGFTKVRIHQFYQVSWHNMPGAAFQFSGQALNQKNVALYDGVACSVDSNNGVWSNLERATLDGLFHRNKPRPNYMNNVLNVWTGQSYPTVGSPSILRTPL